MTTKQIQAAIRANSLTQKSIAAQLQRSEMAISMVVRKQTVSDYIMRGISDIIGKTHTEVFPDYYLSRASRRAHRKHPSPTTAQ